MFEASTTSNDCRVTCSRAVVNLGAEEPTNAVMIAMHERIRGLKSGDKVQLVAVLHVRRFMHQGVSSRSFGWTWWRPGSGEGFKGLRG